MKQLRSVLVLGHPTDDKEDETAMYWETVKMWTEKRPESFLKIYTEERSSAKSYVHQPLESLCDIKQLLIMKIHLNVCIWIKEQEE